MFPLKNKKIIRGCAAHIKAGLGCATDYVADYVELYAPFDGRADAWGGESFQGGNWLNLTRPNGDVIQLAHLSKYKAGGEVREGDLLAITGNTGKVTTGAHLHIQIKDRAGNRLDPEKYMWWNKKDNIVLTWAQVNKLYNAIFGRDADEGARGYVGKDLDFFLNELLQSEEAKRYGRVRTVIKEQIENW